MSSTVNPSLVNPNSNNFSVQHLMTSSQMTSHNQTRPSIIQPVDNSKFTGGLNFSQIRQINTGQINGNGQFVTNQPVTSLSQGHHLKMQQRNKQFQAQQQAAAVALANDLSLIEPTLPFSTTTTSVFTTAQQQQLTQQQVNHNMNVQ